MITLIDIFVNTLGKVWCADVMLFILWNNARKFFIKIYAYNTIISLFRDLLQLNVWNIYCAYTVRNDVAAENWQSHIFSLNFKLAKNSKYESIASDAYVCVFIKTLAYHHLNAALHVYNDKIENPKTKQKKNNCCCVLCRRANANFFTIMAFFQANKSKLAQSKIA